MYHFKNCACNTNLLSARKAGADAESKNSGRDETLCRFSLFLLFLVYVVCGTAHPLFPTMRAPKQTILIDMDGQHGFPPFRMKRFPARRASIGFLCNTDSGNQPDSNHKYSDRNGNHPPRDHVVHTSEMHLTRAEHHGTKQHCQTKHSSHG